MGKAKIGLAVLGGIVILVILLVTMKSCTITKKTSTSDSTQSVTETSGSNNSGKNNTGENNESNSDKSNSKKTDSEKINSENNTDKNSEIDTKEEIPNLVRVDTSGGTSELNKNNSSKQTSVMVSGKNTYLSDRGYYVYSLGLVIPSEYDLVKIEYFCSRKVYDTLNMGDTVVADYSIDSNGYISVNGISR